MAASKATKAAKAAVKKSPPVKKTAAKKLTATEKEADKQAIMARAKKAATSNAVETPVTSSSAVGKNLTVKGTVSAGNVALSKYSAQLNRLATTRGHSVDQEIEIAIHDHVEKYGML